MKTIINILLALAPAHGLASAQPAVSSILNAASGGSRFVIDAQNNRLFSTFGGIIQVPLGPFMTRVSTFKLYVDGVPVASKEINYVAPYRP
jgi:hypothetical protein